MLGDGENPSLMLTPLVMDEDGVELLKLLDGLPLALVQAASYLRVNEMGIAWYIETYRLQWEDLMKTDHRSGSLRMNYSQGSIWTTWSISFDAIQKQNPDTANLLRLWAFFDNKDLWHGLLASATDPIADWPKWVHFMANSEVNFLNSIELLRRYSMIETQYERKGSYSMHPVVHQWALASQNTTEKSKYLQLALLLLGFIVSPRISPEYWVLGRRVLPHAEKCALWAVKHEVDEISLNSIHANHAFHHLGMLFGDLGKMKEAEEMYQRALIGSEKALGPDHMSTLHTVNNLGSLYRKQGKLKEAEEMYQRALIGKEKALDLDHTSTLQTVNNLGNLYRDQGKLKEAEEMYQRALIGKEKALGPDHMWTLDTINNLGNLYSKQGKLKEAEEMYQRALQGYEKAIGVEEIEIYLPALNTIGNLAGLYAKRGQISEARELYVRAHTGRKAVLGPHHRDVELIIREISRLNEMTDNHRNFIDTDRPRNEKQEEEVPKRKQRGFCKTN
jgi:tetratricopeptide (TPR) repeat protein